MPRLPAGRQGLLGARQRRLPRRGLVAAGGDRVRIRQDGFRLELIQTIAAGGQTADLTHPGVIVGSTLVTIDEIASDFEFAGTARPGEVELRPAVDHIRQTDSGYPPNFPPRPDWDALERCTITLVARQTGGGAGV